MGLPGAPREGHPALSWAGGGTVRPSRQRWDRGARERLFFVGNRRMRSVPHLRVELSWMVPRLNLTLGWASLPPRPRKGDRR